MARVVKPRVEEDAKGNEERDIPTHELRMVIRGQSPRQEGGSRGAGARNTESSDIEAHLFVRGIDGR